MLIAPVAVRSLSRLCLSLLYPSPISAFSFPLLKELGPILLRAPSLDSIYISDIDERTISAAGGSNKGGGVSESEL